MTENEVNNLKYTNKDLKDMQAWDLNRKIQVTQTRIAEWYFRNEGNVYVSFSGGKDSTVLLDMVRKQFPKVPAVYIDTGLEYPEIKEFVRSFDNVTVIRPEKSFKRVLEEYGYPIISKEVSQVIEEARKYDATTKKYEYRIKRLNGTLTDKHGKLSPYNCPQYRYLLDAPFKISHKCCSVMKKSPAKKYERETGRKPYIATLATESQSRATAWKRHGCNSFDTPRPTSQPMSFWTEQDVLEYIRRYNLKIASVYGDIVENDENKLYLTGCDRTGCVFCMFGCHLEKSPNRFERLKETHPKLWEYCMKERSRGGLGIMEVLDFIGVETGVEKQNKE